MTRIRLSGALIALSLFVAAGCGDSTSPQSALSLDSAFSQMEGAETFAATGRTMMGAPVMPTHSTGVPSACLWDATRQGFVCPTITRDGVTADRWFQLFDATGATLSAFDRAKVAAIRTVTTVSGTRTMPGGTRHDGVTMPAVTTEFTNESDQTLSGLLTGARTLDGVAEMTSTTTVDGESRTHTMKQTTTKLVLPTARGEYPKSGSITTEMTMPVRFGDAPQTSTMTMTFNGTSVVTITYTSGGITTTCQVDLSQPMPMHGGCSLRR